MLKNVKKVEWIILFLFVVAAAIYYYGLHLSFWPDPEVLYTTLRHYRADKFGCKVSIKRIYDILAYLVYKLFGAGYVSIRIYHTLVYFAVLSLTVILSLCSLQKKQINWYLLPLFTFLAVILNPGSSELCGFHTTMYHVYPYDMHTDSLIAALCGLLLIELLYQTHLPRTGKGIAIAALIGLIIYRRFDLLFIVGFCAPMLCIGALNLWKAKRKIFVNVLLAVFSVVVLLRFLSIFHEPLRGLFMAKELSYGNWTSGGIYGNTGFVEYFNIWKNIANTLTELMALYNAEFSGLGILSVNTLMGSIRVVILVLIIIIALYYVVLSFRRDKELDYISLCAAFGILFNIFIVLFSKYGGSVNCIRYMTIVLFFGAILLCRNADTIIEKYSLDSSYLRKVLFVGFSLCVLIDIKPAWKDDSYQAEYEDIFTQVTNTIMDNQLGNGVGGHWFATNLTALMKGEYAVLEGDYWLSDGGIDLLGVNAPVNYFVEINGDYRWYAEEDIYHYFGEPDRIYGTEDYTIYYYEDGIPVKE